MPTYALKIAYDGTDFLGWQTQPNGKTVQESIEKALQTILKEEEIFLVGSGRTDTGVHAQGQIAHFITKSVLTPEKTLRALNGILPPSIRILEITLKEDNFHARFSAKKKTYQYRICLGRIADPFSRPFTWHVKRPLNVNLMKEASLLLLGTHDFSALTNESHIPKENRDCVRTIFRIDFKENGSSLFIEFEGNGFLYKMVRNLVGLLVDIGSLKKKKEDISKLLEQKDRKQLSATAPPHGLFLMKVDY